MSKPRPIHLIPRAIQAVPDEAEPSFSYEQESFLSTKEEDAEDEFHRRLAAGSRREYSGGTSFWRTTTNTSNGENSSSSSQGPYFSSVSISAKLAGGSEPNSSARADRQPGIMGDSTAGSNNRVSEKSFVAAEICFSFLPWKCLTHAGLSHFFVSAVDRHAARFLRYCGIHQFKRLKEEGGIETTRCRSPA